MITEPSVIFNMQQTGQVIEYIVQSREITDLIFYGFKNEKYLVLTNNKMYS